VIIDGMMALQLLWWASKNGGESQLYDLALSHSVKTAENNIRPDGSSFQIVDYSPSTGAILDRTNKQGYTKTSTWSRGQAWAIYGFAIAYRETGDERFSQTAQKAADFFINNLPADHVPYWDFQAPNIPSEEKDASAAAIAASGLLELSSVLRETGAVQTYRDAACSILASLCSPAYLASGTESRGVLLHGVGNRMNPDRDAGEVDVSLIYADYLFIEAMLRYKKLAPVGVFADRSRAIGSGAIRLFQNYPNPFNATTIVSYDLPGSGQTELSVYDLLGERVRTLTDAFQSAGLHQASWDGNNEAGNPVASGLYFYRLRTGLSTITRQMLVIR
jgi:hypothetical protein